MTDFLADATANQLPQGMSHCETMTTTEIARAWNLSRGRIWQIEQRALWKLWHRFLADPVIRQLYRDIYGEEPPTSPRMSYEQALANGYAGGSGYSGRTGA